MTTADKIPVLCTLARHHFGAHDGRGVAGRKPCGAVVGYVEREAEEVRDGDGLPADPCPVTYHGERCQGLAHHEKMPGYRGHYGENGFFPPEEPCPPPTAPAPVPVEPPSLADLVFTVCSAESSLGEAQREEDEAHAVVMVRTDRVAHARSEVTKRAGKGALVMVGSVLFRSVPPRKPKGGEVPADALWRLEPVEVAK